MPMEPGEQTHHFGGRRWQRPAYAALSAEIGRIEVAALAAQNHCERLLKPYVPDRGLGGISSDAEMEALRDVFSRLQVVLATAREAVEPLRERFSREQATTVP